MKNLFDKNPILLAPLAGVSDIPFRLICSKLGADLTYVEMISATALNYNNKRTLTMMARHPDETILGLQLTARNAEEMGKAVAISNKMPFDTIDINMGCPVRKVVQAGCGASILMDPERVFNTVKQAKENTDKPVSAKIRLGWDREHAYYKEVSDAIQSAGASWITVHGRYRSDTYQSPVQHDTLLEIKKRLQIPMIGNGNLFSPKDAREMILNTQVDGLMVSRGALGNPWVFDDIKNQAKPLLFKDWKEIVLLHLKYQNETYAGSNFGVLCMRKHLLWYLKGWPHAKKYRERVNSLSDFNVVLRLLDEFELELSREFGDSLTRRIYEEEDALWNPKGDCEVHDDPIY